MAANSLVSILKFLPMVSTTGFLRFFFSSRRRHTRFDCDWSSDVCSSDLQAGVDDRRPRVLDDVGRDDRVLGVLEDAFELTVGGCLQRGVDLLDRRLSRRLERSEEHTSELQSQSNLVCRLLLEKKNPEITA